MTNKADVRASQHDGFLLYTVITVLIPIVGLIIGIVHLARDGRLDRKLGGFLTIFSILMMILGGIIWYSILGNKTLTTYSPPTTSSIVDTPVVSSWNPDTYYEQIQTGQTKAQVEQLIKKTPESCTTSDTPGVGKMESCSYGTYTDKGILSITYIDGKVYNKTKINL